MTTYTMSFADATRHVPDHPERTAYRDSGWDVAFRVWPSEGAMRKTVELQGRRARHYTDWRPWLDSNMAKRLLGGQAASEIPPGAVGGDAPRRLIFRFRRHEAGPFQTAEEAEEERNRIIDEIAARDDVPRSEVEEYLNEILEIVPEEKVVWVTTAPADYDYTSYTVELRRQGPLRVVALDPERAGYQTGRYRSGMHFTAPFGSEEHEYFVQTRGGGSSAAEGGRPRRRPDIEETEHFQGPETGYAKVATVGMVEDPEDGRVTVSEIRVDLEDVSLIAPDGSYPAGAMDDILEVQDRLRGQYLGWTARDPDTVMQAIRRRLMSLGAS